jgi:hypothetical protein
LDSDEDLQSQEHEDETDFNSALDNAETYEMLDKAIGVLDDMLRQKQNQFHQISFLSLCQQT